MGKMKTAWNVLLGRPEDHLEDPDRDGDNTKKHPIQTGCM